MKTKIFLLCAVMAFAFTVTGCEDDITKPDNTEITGKYLTVKFNDTVVVPNTNGTLKISFNDVDDGRLYKEMCFVV